MISPLAYVDASAKIGANVTIHPFAYIDKDVVIGDGCEIKPYASVLAGTRMGKNSRVSGRHNRSRTSGFPLER